MLSSQYEAKSRWNVSNTLLFRCYKEIGQFGRRMVSNLVLARCTIFSRLLKVISTLQRP